MKSAALQLHADNKSNEKDTGLSKTSKNSTGGYDGNYASGYSQKNVAEQIRNVSSDMGEVLCKIAKEDGMQLAQTKGYFNFGAGKKITSGKISLIAPTSYTFSKNLYNQELIAYSTDATIGSLSDSPIEIWAERVPLLKKMLICEFFSLHITGAYLANRTYRELVVSGNCAVMAIEKDTSAPLIAHVAVLCHSGMCIYNIKVIINQCFDNAQSIVKRIISSVTIKE